MHKPNLSFVKENDLFWTAGLDDICFETEWVEDIILDFIEDFRQKFPKSSIEVYERRFDEWGSGVKDGVEGSYIMEYKIELNFDSIEDEAEFIILRYCGKI